MNIVLAIKSKYATMIYAGDKVFEYRKKFPKTCDRVYLYETSPVQRITGYFDVDQQRKLNTGATNLWFYTGFQGLSQAELERYLKGKKGWAIGVLNPHKYEHPVDPHQVYDPWYPPQNYRGITHEQELKLWDIE